LAKQFASNIDTPTTNSKGCLHWLQNSLQFLPTSSLPLADRRPLKRQGLPLQPFLSYSPPLLIRSVAGLVASLNRPGGNITGVAALTIELDPKRLELLNEIMPSNGLLGVLFNPTRPDSQLQIDSIKAAAQAVGRELVLASSHTPTETDDAFRTFAQRSVVGVLIAADAFFSAQRKQIVSLVARHGWPAIYQWREFADAGGLASYGPNLFDSYRQAGVFAARILKGEKPADLPVQQPTKFEFILNLRTAKSSA
jgi:putative ABC transport system substrate-binding protein